MSEDGEEMSF